MRRGEDGPPSLPKHGTPFRCGRLRPQPQEAEPGDLQNGDAYAQRGLGLERDQAGGQDVSPQQADRRLSGGPRCQDVVSLLLTQHADAHQPRVGGDRSEGDGIDGTAQAGTEDGDDGDGQQQGGEGQHHAHHAHDQAVGPSPPVAGGYAGKTPRHPRQRNRRRYPH